ncbi:hypothetical protein SNK03_008204 [Fusarium graminearum]|uniref:Chromosome 4, complete genome n=2 Tax=Gibberella zeae TaxID=5518 RepID=I1RRY7_GIBZE|nr:hypothetical protein FGSG_06891 [Fusarium graminearum PH-1]EYB22822.1 hypothetical protein FG05_06891 [Fusarium graminearum]ESU13049.1 hypothetical protein FGSG_06891 [Fusarium graminearum PH-1]PCD19648.1 hypothetical protein FGRA07_05397 [Fusarium graminearum]CAF3440152.1 unnamed protein product [Fusarium graminearum]CAF3465965.1 unnamed protein product [Fusarium graminearum]|eukprot:XP_011326556.1 hypothetical protein FGSG_06891 [Fusarium graminearum PH-1]
MAIREHFRRAMRSDASASNIIDVNTSGKITATVTKSSQNSDKSDVSSKSSLVNKLSRTWTWGSKDKDATKERKSKKGKKITHPSEKPLTAQNLQHQEMLSQFSFTFGASSPEQIEDDDFLGVSPCCTRAPSVVNFSLEGDSESDDQTSSSSSSIKSS